MFGPVCYTIFQMAEYSGSIPRRGVKKPSPGGWCSAQRIQNLYDCQWQSYLYYGVTPFGVTDEVEGHSIVPTYGDDW